MAPGTEGSSGEGAITGASLAINAGNAIMRGVAALGKTLSPIFERVGGHASTAATILSVAEQVHSETGLTHKAERAGAGLASAGVNIALSGAAATAGETAAVTAAAGSAGAVAVAAAPVVLSVAAAGVTAKVADLAIENRRIYEGVDEANARLASPSKIRNRPDGEKPSLTDYFHIGTVQAVSAHMRDEALHPNGKIERFAQSNRIKNVRALDMTDPGNLAEYERALGEEIKKKETLMAANSSFLPRWLRHSDAVGRYNDAASELAELQGARWELAMFKDDLRRYEDQAAGAKSSARTAPRPPGLG